AVMSAVIFTEEQQQYLQGFAAGSGLGTKLQAVPPFATAVPKASVSSVPVGPEAIHHLAQDRQVANGKTLTNEEQAKRRTFPLDQWNDIRQHAADNQFPKGT